MKKALFLLFFLWNLTSYAQQTDVNDQYFDDGGISTTNSIIKVNFVSTLMGNPMIHYERLLAKFFSVDLGVGYVLPYYIPEFMELATFEPYVEKPKTGYSFSVNPRYWPLKNAPEGFYYGLLFRQRHYNCESNTVILRDITYVIGGQYNLTRHVNLNIDMGIGPMFSKYSKLDSYYFETFSFVILAKLGYLL